MDETGIVLTEGEDGPLDVEFDGRRVWSFWLVRDTEEVGESRRLAAWPRQLRNYLDGVTVVGVRSHGDERALFEEERRFGTSTERIAVVDSRGQPLGTDKSGKLVPTFENRSVEQTAPLLDSLETVLAELAAAGVAAFPAYGTLLGAVRSGRLIGHDSDADIGYVSRHRHPFDVIRESFAIQRRLVAHGYHTMRYSGGSFQVLVTESDGFVRGLDVFGGYFDGERLYLMGEVRTPYREEWIFPLSNCELEGRTLPAPAEPERLLEAMYGPGWRVPDPAFAFTTPASTVRAFDQVFRISRARRRLWGRAHLQTTGSLPPVQPSPLAAYVAEGGVPAQLLDVGAGRGIDSLWFARQGSAVTAYDYLVGTPGRAARRAEREGLSLDVRWLNLQEWRSVLAEGARIARLPGPRTVLANHVLEATPAFGRDSLVRFASMALRDGGRLYADFWCGGGEPGETPAWPVRLEEVTALLRRAGAHMLQADEFDDDAAPLGRRTGRVVAQWA